MINNNNNNRISRAVVPMAAVKGSKEADATPRTWRTRTRGNGGSNNNNNEVDEDKEDKVDGGPEPRGGRRSRCWV